MLLRFSLPASRRATPCPRRGRIAAAILLGALSSACERPDVLVVCHNANCAGPPDPSQDDTLDSLRESLALTYRGRPLLDGMELDIFWHGAANGGLGRCTFAHDVDTAAAAADATAAASEIAAYLRRSSDVAHGGQRFHIRLELKGSVGSYGDEHSAVQLQQHADCALDLFEIFRAAAVDSGHPIRVIFDSSEPRVLRALCARDRWPGRLHGGPVETRLSADFVDSMPSGLALQYLADFPEVDDVVFHADWIREGHYQAFRSLDLSLTLWMFSATAVTFDAVERFEPDAVLTSEAPLMRSWLAY